MLRRFFMAGWGGVIGGRRQRPLKRPWFAKKKGVAPAQKLHQEPREEQCRMSRWVAFAVGLWLASFARASTPTTIVAMAPAEIGHRTFDPANPPAEMPKLTPPEVGTCVFKFECRMATAASGGSGPMPTRVSEVALRGRLVVTIWTPVDVTARVLLHEEGHRRICELYYASADPLAHRIADEALGTPLYAQDKSELERELDRLQKRCIAEFLRETATRCEHAQRRFDAITDHSRNAVQVGSAIVEAIHEENAEHGGG
jgi:hypothetical protein